MTEIVKFRDEYEEMQIEITLNLTFISFQTNPIPGLQGPKVGPAKFLKNGPGWTMDPNDDLENGPELIMRLEVD